MKLDVKTLENKKKGDIELADAVFAIDPREDIVARVVKWQLAKRRAGTHLVKGRSDIARTGKKMFRQKGTGRARAGNGSVSQFRGGGVVHGPVLRGYEHKLPKKVRNLGMKSVLSAKLASGNLIVVDDLKASGKTAELKGKLESWALLMLWLLLANLLMTDLARLPLTCHLLMFCLSRAQMFMICCAVTCLCCHVMRLVILRSV